jgi:hypothetical protein
MQALRRVLLIGRIPRAEPENACAEGGELGGEIAVRARPRGTAAGAGSGVLTGMKRLVLAFFTEVDLDDVAAGERR